MFKSILLIYLSKANLDGKICLVRSHISETQKLEKCLERGLYGNQELHFLFLSMIYVAFKFTLQVSEMEL